MPGSVLKEHFNKKAALRLSPINALLSTLSPVFKWSRALAGCAKLSARLLHGSGCHFERLSYTVCDREFGEIFIKLV